jgi:arginyl-tRNA synthetase
MRKSDGTFTYFVPDVAYHLNKFKRGFVKAINIQGSDHHGTIARVKAGLQAMNEGVDANFVQYILHKMVTVMKNGQEVKISKRAGSYITLRDLIEWSGEHHLTAENNLDEQSIKQINLTKGRDVVRFFLISRKADTEFIFDVDLALKENDENPVYYIQYAHARICSVLQQVAQNQAINLDDLSALWQTHQLHQYYTHTSEMQLMQRLAQYLSCLQDCAANYAPHLLAFYLKDLATDFHRFYTHCKVIQSDTNIMYARLALMQASKKILAHGLQLLGISAPSKM